ncbi:MAG: SDR family NAD(P)-dependent oxidoreductase, partial [Calditrichaeota bacterium]|nr:SDR family NAD(P)-dependent oxidoreductase [Calditrichota bacterium]
MGSRTVLVTGGAGFIGSHLVDRLVELGHRVRILDNLDPQVHPGGEKPAYLNPEAEFIFGDIRDTDTVRRALQGVEVVFHEAAAVGVGQSQYQIRRYVDVNTRGTANLLDVLANEPNSVEKIVVAASMSSYGEGKARCPECGVVKPSLRPESQMAAGHWEVRCPYCQTPTEPVPTDEHTERQVNSVYSLTKKDQEDLVLLFGRTYGVQAVALRYFNVFGP